ncbi:MAG: hypothetical protein QOE76_3130 [Frankiales bacterium]|jgi:hypothetical protein|nr:hypothetical protein [Frankiales bacterium]
MIDLHLARPSRIGLRPSAVAAAIFALLVLAAGTGVSADAATAGTVSPSASASPAASGRATFGIKPSHATLAEPIDVRPRFEYTATPGAQQPDFVAISNNALTPLHLNVYASDGFNTSSDGFDLLAASKKPVDVGSWITLKTNVIDLKPGATVVIPFTVRVPAKVAPGDHVGGIVASLRTYGVDKKGDRVAIDQRVGARVYLRIQGPLQPQLTVTNLKVAYRGSLWNPFAKGRVTVSYTLHNPGNVRLGAHQAVEASGWYGAVHSASSPDVPELLPDNAHDVRVVISGVEPAFHDRVRLTVTPFALGTDIDGRLTDVVRTVHFWAVPWGLLVLLCLLVTLLVVSWRRLRRRRPRVSTQVPPAAEQQRSNAGVKP